MIRSFSLLQVAICALILTGAGLIAMPARAQNDNAYHPYHSDLFHMDSLFHSDSSQPDPYHYQPFHSTYDGSSHSSDSQEGVVPLYHPFTMNPPYTPSSTPRYHFENGSDGNGTIVGPNGPVWHDGLGHVDTGSLQKQGADATVLKPYTPPSLWHPTPALSMAPMNDQHGQVGIVLPHIKPLEDPEKARERFFDSPPGPYGSVTPIVNPVPPSGN